MNSEFCLGNLRVNLPIFDGGGSASAAYKHGKRRKGHVVGSKRWFESMDPQSPVYFDTSLRKGKKSGVRYELF